jgi:hypothetical protein
MVRILKKVFKSFFKPETEYIIPAHFGWGQNAPH